jgi:hypothetical protein
MKLKHIYTIAVISSTVIFSGCADPDYITPETTVTPTNMAANFIFANASTDAPALNLLLNNTVAGASVNAGEGQNGYTKIPLGSNGVIANTNIRARAVSGTIGGLLGSSDLIYRSSNNGTNNFAAADSAYYTVFALDSLTRPKPLRTLNAKNFGDTTYFNPATGAQLSVVERAALTAAQKAKLVALGTVPLGSSDPGGLRFLIITDQLPLPFTPRFPKPSATQASVRFIHLSPDAGTVTARYNASSITSGIFSYPMRFPAFSPSVGSRTTTAGFQNITAGTYDLTSNIGANEIARTNAYTFAAGGIYTVYLSGKLAPVKTLKISVIRHK